VGRTSPLVIFRFLKSCENFKSIIQYFRLNLLSGVTYNFVMSVFESLKPKTAIMESMSKVFRLIPKKRKTIRNVFLKGSSWLVP